MEYDQGRQPGPPLRTEILLDARKRACDVANVAATIAFFIMKDGWEVAPGVTFARIVEMYAPDLRVKHILFVAPFQWDRGMTRWNSGTGRSTRCWPSRLPKASWAWSKPTARWSWSGGGSGRRQTFWTGRVTDSHDRAMSYR